MPLADHVTERAQARVGTVLRARWRLDGVIGVGGMATVYAATHRNKSRVAIKVLHPEVALDSDVTARFLREGYVANMVEHPGTVKVLDDDVAEDGAPFLVMELLEGETVDGRWSRKGQRLAVNEVLAIADQMLDVLAIAHDKGIVHRDLKPENLFLTRNGELKILDFGIARLREVSPDGSSTRAGSLLGTPAFMSPEQARGRWEEVDARTDIWAIGATLFTLLTGGYVHEAETVQEQLIRAATTPATSIGSLLPELSPAVVELVDRALAFERTERWSDARRMRAALRAAMERDSNDGPLTLPTPSSPNESATLIAPPELVSAITGRSYTTARPVTNPVSHSEPARRSPLIALTVALSLALGVSAGTAIYVVHGAATPSAGALQAITPAGRLPARVVTPLPAPASDDGEKPSVSPTTEAPAVHSVPQKPVTTAGHKPSVKPVSAGTKPESGKPATPAVKPTETVKPPSPQNPFDRRL